jgi:serine/threonine protein kinase
MPNRIGQKFGNYHLVSLLGEGGFAEVYLGEHIHLGTKAAIKVQNTKLTKDDVEMFRNEARTVANLVHPHIVRVLDFGMEDNVPYLVMDYASNGSLRQIYPRGTHPPLSRVTSYVKQVAEALQYAHERKMIHRDIKPENMLLGQGNEVLLSDFGIATIAHNTSSFIMQAIAGTIPYMAPEQIQQHPRPASDQYSLGIVVYEWLSGERPFQGSSTEIAVKHSTALPPSLQEKSSTISQEVEQVVFKALAKDPKERFEKVIDFATTLEQAILLTQLQSPILQNISSASNQPSAVLTKVITPPNSSLPPDNLSPVQHSKEALVSNALKLLEAERYVDALTTINIVLAFDSNLAYVHNIKGLSLYQLKRYKEALTSLDHAITLNPNDETVLFGRGLVLEKLKRFTDALLEYDKVTRFDATYASAWRQKGIVLAEMKRYEEALTAYEKALQLNENDADACIGKGNVLKHLGRLK